MTYTLRQQLLGSGLMVSFTNDTPEPTQGVLFNVYADGQQVVTGGSNETVMPGGKLDIPVSGDALKQNLVKYGQTLDVRAHLSQIPSNSITYQNPLLYMGLGGLALVMLMPKLRRKILR